MRTASALFASLALVSLPLWAAPHRNLAPDSCPVTLPTEPRFTPPNAKDEFGSGFWHGDERLAVHLNPAVRLFGPKERQKMIWYRRGYTWQDDRTLQDNRRVAPLRITGRRLDSANDAAPYIEGPSNALLAKEFTVMMNIIVFPEAGCWQLEGNYDGDYLAFVVWVD